MLKKCGKIQKIGNCLMYTLLLSNKFEKSLLKIKSHKKFKKEIFNKVINTLLSGEKLSKKYKEHKLSGKYRGCFECHVQNDILLIYSFNNKKLYLYAIDIGTHSELFE